MEANNFVAALKAEGTEKDRCDLTKVFEEYKAVMSKLDDRERGPFSLNVLCILCRNINKVASWSTAVDLEALLTLSIECLRQTRCLSRPELVKALACLYHIHKFTVNQNSRTSPTLILKISYMAFENNVENMLSEYVKTYWNIFADRLLYIDKLKAQNCSIAKLLPKVMEDLEKIMEIYNTVQFASNVIVFLVKKLYGLFGDTSPMELNKCYSKIFEILTKKNDLSKFKKLSEKEALDLYLKFNECFCVIADNSAKLHFKESSLSNVVRCTISLFGQSPDIFHCLQTFYSNLFCVLLAEKQILTYNETLLKSVINSCETTEKLGYKKAMICTYPYLIQLLRIYMEYALNNYDKNKWLNHFSGNIQNACMSFTLFLMKKSKDCNQLLKCENCEVKTGLHDAMRLSFLTKSFITYSLAKEVDVSKILPSFSVIVKEQYVLLKNLRIMGCVNNEKCYKKLQTDIHNLAINLNKAKYYEFSLKLFDIYLKNEILSFKNESDLINVSRALYNKSICQIDCGSFGKALTDAYLSLVFAYPLVSEKHMSLVMDIKAKILKANEGLEDEEDTKKDKEAKDTKDTRKEKVAKDLKIEEEKDARTQKDTKIQDKSQLMTSLNVCENSLEHDVYGNLKRFFCTLKFSEILKHEFKMYVRLWPSVLPIAGVWMALHNMFRVKPKWLAVPDNNIKSTLYEIILETPTAVRNINNVYFKKIVDELLSDFGNNPNSTEMRIIHATLLLLKSEFELNETCSKYGWKTTDSNMDPDFIQINRTASKEYETIKSALKATRIWSDVVKKLNRDNVSSLPPNLLPNALQMMKLSALRFLTLTMEPQGLQMAHLCCQIASYIGDRATYTQYASIIIYYAQKKNEAIDDLIKECSKTWRELASERETMDIALNFICDCALYYYKCEQIGLAAQLTRTVQAYVLKTVEGFPELKLDMTVGRLLELQSYLCPDAQTALSHVNGVQRHYLTVAKEGSSHTSRTAWRLCVLVRVCVSSLECAVRCGRALLWRRARAAAAVALPRSTALYQAKLIASIINCHSVQDAGTKIDNHLKYILNVSTKREPQSTTFNTQSKSVQYTPKQEIETMLENTTFRKTQTSPSVSCDLVPGFNKPDFLTHNTSCQCCNCQNPNCQILSCQTGGLEASMYFRAKEFDIARNYFTGVLNTFGTIENRLKSILKRYRDVFEGYLVDILEESYWYDFKTIQIEILIEYAFFQLSQDNPKMADELVVQIHEIMMEYPKIDKYLKNEILNLMLTCAKKKTEAKKPIETGLEAEMESLKLSPEKVFPPQKTPENKPKKMPKVPKAPKVPKIMINDEDIHKKRRVLKLNLNRGPDEENSVKKTKPKKERCETPRLNIRKHFEQLTNESEGDKI